MGVQGAKPLGSGSGNIATNGLIEFMKDSFIFMFPTFETDTIPTGINIDKFGMLDLLGTEFVTRQKFMFPTCKNDTFPTVIKSRQIWLLTKKFFSFPTIKHRMFPTIQEKVIIGK